MKRHPCESKKNIVSIGRAVNQLEEPFSEDNMMDQHNDGDNMGIKAS